MKAIQKLSILVVGSCLVGCESIPPVLDEEVVVQAASRIKMGDPALDKSGKFFLQRSMLCRTVFAKAISNLVVRTGRNEDALRGVTICGLDEGFTNGVYTLRLDVVWSPLREWAVEDLLATMNAVDQAFYVPSAEEERALWTWVGPKQVLADDGEIRFLGFSSAAVGRNTVLSQQNIKWAELDAKAMAVRPFLGKERKVSAAKAVFRQVLRKKCRHPLCRNRDMYVCGYELVSLEKPTK